MGMPLADASNLIVASAENDQVGAPIEEERAKPNGKRKFYLHFIFILFIYI